MNTLRFLCARFHKEIAKGAEEVLNWVCNEKGATLTSLLCKLKQNTEKEDRKDLDYVVNAKHVL